MKKFLTNLFTSKLTTVGGSVVGLPDIYEGVITHDWIKVIRGLALFILGCAANENGTTNPAK